MDWVKQVREDGYAVLPGVISESEATGLLRELLESNLPRSRAGIRHLMAQTGVAKVARGPELMTIARGLLGDKTIPFRATLFDKSQGSNWLVMWHQDTALPLIERQEKEGWGPWSVKDGVNYAHAPAAALEKVLALRLHLDDSAIDNGPLRVLPRTHRSGVLGDEEMHSLSEQIGGIDCTVQTGGVVVVQPLVVHASSKSLGGQPRRVLHIEYAETREILPGMPLAIV
jgi:Phytanoyl-CoA dioxygenase (PhyH)